MEDGAVRRLLPRSQGTCLLLRPRFGPLPRVDSDTTISEDLGKYQTPRVHVPVNTGYTTRWPVRRNRWSLRQGDPYTRETTPTDTGSRRPGPHLVQRGRGPSRPGRTDVDSGPRLFVLVRKPVHQPESQKRTKNKKKKDVRLLGKDDDGL